MKTSLFAIAIIGLFQFQAQAQQRGPILLQAGTHGLLTVTWPAGYSPQVKPSEQDSTTVNRNGEPGEWDGAIIGTHEISQVQKDSSVSASTSLEVRDYFQDIKMILVKIPLSSFDDSGSNAWPYQPEVSYFTSNAKEIENFRKQISENRLLQLTLTRTSAVMLIMHSSKDYCFIANGETLRLKARKTSFLSEWWGEVKAVHQKINLADCEELKKSFGKN